MVEGGKALTIRLSAEQAKMVEALGYVDGVPAAQIVRQAIAFYAEARRRDPAYVAQAQDKRRDLDAIVGAADDDGSAS